LSTFLIILFIYKCLTEKIIGEVSDIYGKIIEDEYSEHFPASKHARVVVNPKCMACIGN